MQEENTVQEQEQTPRVSRVREYMTAKFPDREFGDDSELEQALYDYLTQSDKKIAGHRRSLHLNLMYSRKLTQRNKRNLIRHLLLHLQKEQQAINQL